MRKAKIAIVGGGVAGATSAIYLAKLGLDVTLFEKESSLVSGPPFCHLHAGGNLYREISDEQCVKLLKQSIDFLKFYPFVVDYRRTVIALPTTDKQTPEQLLPRLELLRKEYEKLIEKDSSNQVLGEPREYFRLYSKEDLERLKSKEIPTKPKNADEWMVSVAQNLDFERVQFPLVLVQEYGLNLFRLASGATLILENMKNVTLRRDTEVINIQREEEGWLVGYNNKQESFDYLINSAGFRTGKIDDMLGVPCKRMVEFKAAYVSYWKSKEQTPFPEIIFHGERGTPQGMGQFTPYPNGYFQLHGMTNDITLYDDGLVANTPFSCQPKLKENFMQKIEKSWNKDEVEERTKLAIEHIGKFIPNFLEATVGSKPLFGAQQIPGDDPTLRVAEVSFPTKGYARCEIVKVSSVIDMVRAIGNDLTKLGYLDIEDEVSSAFNLLEENKIDSLAQILCKQRGYPRSLGCRNIVA